ncbi:putative CBL-interacting protein kinase 13 [Hordeum vulgare]|nr:putative CBL-interacting protein kinase 13 [Hordeum vulgare]
MSLARIWGMFDDENSLRLRQTVVNAEENFMIMKEKEKMEKDLRFFKVNFAKMVGDKEEALNQLGNAQIALSDLKQELEKKSLCDKTCQKYSSGVKGQGRERERWTR